MTELKASKLKRIIQIFFVSSVLIGIMLFVRLAVFSSTKGISGKDTAILNPKYEDTVSEILLKSAESDTGEIRLFKQDGFWLGRATIDNQETVFPLNNAKFSEFLKALSSIRKVYHISDNVSLYKDYNLDSNAFAIEARDSSKAILLELFLGNLNYSASKISFRTGKSTAIYETESDLAPYRHIEPESWADMLLLSAEHAAFDETEVLICTVDGSEVFQDNRTELETFVHKLIASRGSVVKPPFLDNSSRLSRTEDFAHIVLIEAPNKVIRLFVLKNDFNETYSVQSEINGKLSEYSLEISSWTFNNLFEFL